MSTHAHCKFNSKPPTATNKTVTKLDANTNIPVNSGVHQCQPTTKNNKPKPNNPILLTVARKQQETYSPTDHNYNKILLKHIDINKHASTPILQHLHNIRTNFLSTITHSNRIPHPTKTHHVIYVAFSTNSKHWTFYPGKTRNNVLVRRQQEIQRALAGDQRPLYKFIRATGPDNFFLFPMTSVKNWGESHYYEHHFIRLLNTQRSQNNPKGLNASTEHAPRAHKQTNNNTNKPTIPNNTPRLYGSRNWVNRTQHLLHVQAIQPNKHLQTIISSLSLKSLHRIYAILTNKPLQGKLTPKAPFYQQLPNLHTSITSQHSSSELQKLAKHIHTTIKALTKPAHNTNSRKRFNGTVFLHQFTHPILHTIKLNQIIQKHTQELGGPISKLLQPRLIYYPQRKLSHYIRNDIKTNKQATHHNNYLYLPKCHCATINKKYLNTYGHVDTCDPTIVINPKVPISNMLSSLLQKGTKYIETPNINNQTILAQLKQSLSKFLYKFKQTRKLNFPQTQAQSWTNNIIQEVTTKLNSIPSKSKHQPFTILTRGDVQSYLKKLKQRYVFNITDKLPNNFSITCKAHWLSRLSNSLHSSQIPLYRIQPKQTTTTTTTPHKTILKQHTTNPKQTKLPQEIHVPKKSISFQCAYSTIKKTHEQIIKDHMHYLKQFNLTVHKRLAPRLNNNKQHKVGDRPLVAAYNTTTTDLCKVLHHYLQLILTELQNAHPNEYLAIKNTQQITQLLTTLNADPLHIPESANPHDITGCYDNIDQDDLCEVYRIVIPKLTPQKYVGITVTKHEAKWTRHPHTSTIYKRFFSNENLLQLLQWKVKNTYVTFGKQSLLQIKGIGQGDNHCVEQCTLYLAFYEIQALLYLKKHDLQAYQTLTNSRRMLDDILFINANQYVQKYLYLTKTQIGFYPKQFLKVNPTQGTSFGSTNKAEYLDLSIQIKPNPIPDTLQKYVTNRTSINTAPHNDLTKLASILNLPTNITRKQLIGRINNFLDNKPLHLNKPHHWHTVTFNKKDKFPKLPIIPYTHFTTNTTLAIKLSTFIGRLHNFTYTNNTNINDFFTNTTTTANTLIKNGYPRQLLIPLITKFLHKKRYLYSYSHRQATAIFYKHHYKNIKQIP